jgi:TonB family protein
MHHFRGVGGDWPLGARWEGVATIEEYSMVAQGNRGVGMRTAGGLVQLLGMSDDFRDREAVAVLSYNGAGSGMAGRLAFDEAERWYTAELRRNDGVMRSPSGVSTTSSMAFSGIQGGGVPGGAVRVGGNVRPPAKIVDVPPVLPEQAARAGIRGTVILELTIGVDGTVKDARVLRGIPPLNEAALEAVRQWRYEPTTIDGTPVPVILTVPVAF